MVEVFVGAIDAEHTNAVRLGCSQAAGGDPNDREGEDDLVVLQPLHLIEGEAHLGACGSNSHSSAVGVTPGQSQLRRETT
jgi:hypothetical protein